MKEDCMMVSTSIEKKNQQQIQLRLSTIFKQKVIGTPQTFESFYDPNGEKYCAVSVLSKYLGYDIAAVASNKIQDAKNINPPELIPYAMLERIESFADCGNPKNDLPKCFCSRPDYYYRYSLTSLLIHLNDYHKMTFTEIGNWLESKGM
ncbi:MAG: hypothetical protein M3270_00610 [Thermoproteota archaeon]|nr:hypothetical protein [Thermoproteota archaeon]